MAVIDIYYQSIVRDAIEAEVDNYGCRRVFGVINRFYLNEEFPILTLRKINIDHIIDELLWIFQKKSNNIHDLDYYNLSYDKYNVDDNGSIGRSMGWQMGNKNRVLLNDQIVEMDQVDFLINKLKNKRYNDHLVLNMYSSSDIVDMSYISPTISIIFNSNGKELHSMITSNQIDIIRELPESITKFALLTIMISRVTGYIPGIMTYCASSAILLNDDKKIADEIISRPIRLKPPTLYINTNVVDFYDFNRSDFDMKEYEYFNLDI